MSYFLTVSNVIRLGLIKDTFLKSVHRECFIKVTFQSNFAQLCLCTFNTEEQEKRLKLKCVSV